VQKHASPVKLKKKKKQQKYSFQDKMAYKTLFNRFGPILRQYELLAIATTVQRNMKPPVAIDRDAKRRKDLLYKWFDDNFDAITPVLSKVVFLNANNEVIPDYSKSVDQIVTK
jgi:hypothetical protein